MMNITSVHLRDYEDLTRQELIERLKRIKALQLSVTHTHSFKSPRVFMAFGATLMMLVMVYGLTRSVLFTAVACAGTFVGVLRYSTLSCSTLPMNWDQQLRKGITRTELLASSPLRLYLQDEGASWEYAQHCLEREVALIHDSLSLPSAPFTA